MKAMAEQFSQQLSAIAMAVERERAPPSANGRQEPARYPPGTPLENTGGTYPPPPLPPAPAPPERKKTHKAKKERRRRRHYSSSSSSTSEDSSDCAINEAME